MKKALHFLLIFALLLPMVLTGCGSTSDLLDDYVGQLASGFQDYTQLTPEMKDVLDTLDLMLDNYVSGLNKPSADEIPQNDLDSDDQNIFQSVTDTCTTVEEMKSLLFDKLSKTEKTAKFLAVGDSYSNDVLYDVVFNQLYETHMIETMGLYQYQVTTWRQGDKQVAVEVEFGYYEGKYTLEQVKSMKDQTLAKAREIVRQLDLANLSVYHRIEAVNRYLIDNCVYPEAEPYSWESHTAYGALLEQSAVCEGYARSFKLLMDLCDVPCYYVVGETPNGGHGWNLVEINGVWYQVDTTWNDTENKRNSYFLVTDAFMSLSRTWDRSRYPATATTPYQVKEKLAMAENEISFDEIKNVFALQGKNVGCTVKLRGKVVLIAFLINDGESCWDKESEKLFVDSLKQIADDLMVKSSLNREQLDIAYAFCQVSVPYIVDKRNSKRFVNDVLRQFGTYEDIQAYQKHYEEKFARDEACVSFVFNKNFRSYAVKISKSGDPESEDPTGNEYSIVSFDTKDTATSRNTFVHELMHQFGAYDLYYPEWVKMKAELHLPGSIMNDGGEIDPLTRYVIGWDDTPSKEAKEFLKSVSGVTEADIQSARRKEWE